MNAQELLVRLTERQIDSLFRAARQLPEDRLDWQPAPGARSARDQLQEVATAIDVFWSAYTERKIEWSDEAFVTWAQDRAKYTTLDELESKAKQTHARLYELIRMTDPSELTAPVQLPFPATTPSPTCSPTPTGTRATTGDRSPTSPACWKPLPATTRRRDECCVWSIEEKAPLLPWSRLVDRGAFFPAGFARPSQRH